jgi:hypothetical protein
MRLGIQSICGGSYEVYAEAHTERMPRRMFFVKPSSVVKGTGFS